MTAVKTRWRIRCNQRQPIRSLCRIRQPVSSDPLRPDPRISWFSNQRPSAPFLLSLTEPAGRKTFYPPRCNITFTQQSKRFSVLLFLLSSPNPSHCRSFQNNRMYYLIRVPEKVFFAFIFFHLILIVSFFVYVLNYYASTNPAAFGMLKN